MEASTEDDLRQMLRQMMKERGITQTELAEAIGITKGTLSKELSGAKPLGKKTLAFLGYKRDLLFRKIRRK